MNPVLPRLALHALRRTAHPMLVAARRGQVLHLVDAGCCHPEHSLTPTGRLRRQLRPLCGQTGRAWHYQDGPSRPLCGYCTAIATRHVQPADWRRLDVLDVLRAAAMATDADGMRATIRALLEVPGLTRDVSLRCLIAQRRAELLPRATSPRDIAWLHGTRPTPHPHPPVRSHLAA
jgi:hypothetical protein